MFRLLTLWLIRCVISSSLDLILLVFLLLLEYLLELPLLLNKLPLVLLNLCHALIVLLVLEPGERLAALNAREVPRTPALALTVLVHLILLQSCIANLASKDHHCLLDLIYLIESLRFNISVCAMGVIELIG